MMSCSAMRFSWQSGWNGWKRFDKGQRDIISPSEWNVLVKRSVLVNLQRPDYYRILEVKPDASQETIRKKYRYLARKYHPDVARMHPQKAEKMFKSVSEAFSVLGSIEMREQYDREYRKFSSRTRETYRENWSQDVGEDIKSVLTLTLQQAVLGCEIEVALNALSRCRKCMGSGTSPGGRSKTCEICRGHGEFYKTLVTADDRKISTLTVCPQCSGKGFKVVDSCDSCFGSGLKRDTKSISVTIPPGVEDESVLRVSGQGDASAGGGRNGDVLLKLKVLPNDTVRRQGQDLISDLSIPLWMALLGGSIQVKTWHGSLKTLIIPAGTQHGYCLTVPDEGVMRKGNQYYVVSIVIPKIIEDCEEQKRILNRLQSLHG